MHIFKDLPSDHKKRRWGEGREKQKTREKIEVISVTT